MTAQGRFRGAIVQNDVGLAFLKPLLFLFINAVFLISATLIELGGKPEAVFPPPIQRELPAFPS